MFSVNKTTMLKTIYPVLKSSSGQVEFDLRMNASSAHNLIAASWKRNQEIPPLISFYVTSVTRQKKNQVQSPQTRKW